MANNRLWRWQGLSAAGEKHDGALWANSRDAALLALAADGITPLSLQRQRVQSRYWHIQYAIQFVRQLATLLQAGVTLADGINLMAQQHPVLQWRALMHQLARQIMQGASFSDALREWPRIFSPLFVALIHTGELTGKLDECCQHLATQQEAHWQLRKKVQKALRYPLFIVVIAILVTAGMLGFVLPEFAAIYHSFNTPLPALTQGVMALSDVFASHGLLFLATALGIAAVIFLLRDNVRFQTGWQRTLLSLPLAGELIRGQRLTQLYTVLTLTQQAGIPLLDGLHCARSTLPPAYWQPIVLHIKERVEAGEPLWQTLQQEIIFSPWCVPLIRTGEMSGALDIMLGRLAALHAERTRDLADGLAASLEPLIMAVMGGIIGTLVVAMYLPIFQLGDAMSAG